ncbi:MAG: mobilization protein MbpA [Bacteroidota bacterium]
MKLRRRFDPRKRDLKLKRGQKQEPSRDMQIRLQHEQDLQRRLLLEHERNESRRLELESQSSVSLSEALKQDLKLGASKNRKKEHVESEKDNSERNSRCVSVDTISPAPEGRMEKKERFKGKSQLVKFRCSTYEKKLLTAKAKLCGLSLSEFLRRTAMEQTTVERLTDEEIELYKMLAKYHNNFKSIGNMFRGKNDSLTKMVYDTAKEIKDHLKKFSK